MKRHKKEDRKTIEKHCLDVWSMIVRARDRTCRNCGAETGLQAHHIRSRRHKSTYLLLRNGLCLCSRCHCLQRFDPEKFQDMIAEIVPSKEYATLKAMSLKEFHPTVPWLLEQREYLRKELLATQKDMTGGIL